MSRPASGRAGRWPDEHRPNGSPRAIRRDTGLGQGHGRLAPVSAGVDTGRRARRRQRCAPPGDGLTGPGCLCSAGGDGMSLRTRGRQHDVWTLLGVGVVAIAAAVLSFSSLQALAVRAGYTPALAALLPLAIDAQAVVATRAWLTAGTSQRTYRYARALALAAVAGSVAGNAGQHAMTAAGVTTPWWVVVAIASVPPVALAATAHLAALLAAENPATKPATTEHAATEDERSPDAPSEHSEGGRSRAHTTPAVSAHNGAHDNGGVSAQPATPADRATPRKRSSGKRSPNSQRARVLFDQHAESGTLDQLTGREIADAGNVSDPTGRRWLAAWRAEHDANRPQLAVVGEQT
ncbi:MAG: DUF2637 domain-containing protein [Actinophytocola sp.]|nr:DUF2637 domain-containing protein [Actinophytocola sp.]